MKIQILGPGCYSCKLLAEKTRQAARELELDCEIEKVEDMNSIAVFGLLMTPALVIDGEVKVSGRVPPLPEIKELLSVEPAQEA